MLIQLAYEHPQMLGTVLQNTPRWVFCLLLALLALGLSQVRARRASLMRMMMLPLAMTGLSLWGTASAFQSSPRIGAVVLIWLLGAATLVLLTATRAATDGSRWHEATASFELPGSWLPLCVILGIFLTKYIVGVDLAMQPALVQDSAYSLTVAGLYGAFSGFFAGRSLRLLRLAFGRSTGQPVHAA